MYSESNRMAIEVEGKMLLLASHHKNFLGGYLSCEAMGPQLRLLGPQLQLRSHNNSLSRYLSRKGMGPQLGPREMFF